ncbi:hypothetical protein [Arcobacter sp. YIC-310]|uniref:hypothetical protein n=1 Tax=Arcobacter sp. YIC-310 TaxID=3376632 RepID=UPI003C23D459
MVRLVITDFSSRQENEDFYINDEFDVLQNMFTYSSFKKHSVLLSKYETSNEVFSLNLLSKKYLDYNQILVHIADEEYYILFNHKTVYTAKINPNFITDDITKSILITKHIAMLSSGGDIENIYYVLNSKYDSAIENIFIQNTKLDNGEIIAKKLGDVEKLVDELSPLDTLNTYTLKSSYMIGLIIFIVSIVFFALPAFEKKYIKKSSLSSLENNIKVQKRSILRQKILLRTAKRKQNELVQCVTKKGVLK